MSDSILLVTHKMVSFMVAALSNKSRLKTVCFHEGLNLDLLFTCELGSGSHRIAPELIAIRASGFQKFPWGGRAPTALVASFTPCNGLTPF